MAIDLTTGDGILEASGHEAIAEARYEVEHAVAAICLQLPPDEHAPAPGFYDLALVMMALDEYKRAIDASWSKVFRSRLPTIEPASAPTDRSE